jgi:hypothetical protein
LLRPTRAGNRAAHILVLQHPSQRQRSLTDLQLISYRLEFCDDGDVFFPGLIADTLGQALDECVFGSAKTGVGRDPGVIFPCQDANFEGGEDSKS